MITITERSIQGSQRQIKKKTLSNTIKQHRMARALHSDNESRLLFG